MAARRESGWPHYVRQVSVWSVIAGVVVFAVAFGLRPWVIVLASFALLYAAVNRALSRRVEEWLERKPDLDLEIARRDGPSTVVTQGAPRPWPVDIDRVVTNEIERLTEEAQAREATVRRPGALVVYSGALMTRPRPEEYDKAREKFVEELSTYESELREWLRGYCQAADERSRTFELSLVVNSSKRGAYAEDVTLVIELPLGAEITEEWATTTVPPEPPTYVPPQPRSLVDLPRLTFAGVDLTSFDFPEVPRISIWRVSSDGHRVETGLGAIHHGRSIEIGEPLTVRVPCEGRHKLQWTLYVKNGRRHCSGALELVVPRTPERPAFRRLHGIESFPDVPFIDEDGKVVREPRTEDPPTSPPAGPTGESAIEWLVEGRAYDEWFALGLAEEAAGGRRSLAIRTRRPGEARPGDEADADG
jgi:hypothetical protein